MLVPGRAAGAALIDPGQTALDELLAAAIEVSEASASVRAIARALVADHASSAGAPAAAPSALAQVAHVFQLSGFERAAMLLAVAAEVDQRYAALFASLDRTRARRWPSVGLAMRLLGHTDGASILSLDEGGHLHHHGLIELVGDGPLVLREYRVPHDVWPRLVGSVRLEVAATGPTHGALDQLVLPQTTLAAARAAAAWLQPRAQRSQLVVVRGPRGSGRTALARAILSEVGIGAIELAGDHLAARITSLCREGPWQAAAVVVDTPVSLADLGRLSQALAMALVVTTDDASFAELAAASRRRAIEVVIDDLATVDRARLWSTLLPSTAEVEPRELATQLRFGPRQIAAIAARVHEAGGPFTTAALVRAGRQLDRGMVRLAQRLPCPFDFDDLVVAPSTRTELDLLRAWALHGHRAFGADGAGGRLHQRAGVVALFAGPPGTGKTMAAQSLARQLDLELLRVDLSQVVNKYIGETEKNLDQVFAAAEAVGAVLFFDEADALFGKRTEVKDANDRFANVETGFLLQRLEAHRGIVILATNLQRNLDDAFLRRIQIVAEFPLPGPEERLQIWRRHLALDRCAADLEIEPIAARFQLSGGDIKNAVTTAVLLATTDGELLGMRHLVLGVWRELRKSGRLVESADFGPWHELITAQALALRSAPARAATAWPR